MNVYDQPKPSSRLLRSKKMSKSTEDTTKLDEQARQRSKFDSTKQTAERMATLEMPIKITSLNAIRKDQLNKSPDENAPKKIELRRPTVDYAQTDENETLQDISTSFSEEKFDSLPEQMTSEVIRKQFHEAFKSMSIVNEEMSDLDSSLDEDKKTEIEKVVRPTGLATDKSLTGSQADKKASLDKKASSEEKISIKESKKDGMDVVTILKEDKKPEIDLKPTVKVSFQQVNQMSKTVGAFKNEQDAKLADKQIEEKLIKKEESKDLTNADAKDTFDAKIDEQLVDENNNEVLKDLGEIIITTSVQNIFTANYLKQEQTEMIQEGWVVVDSIEEIDENELRKEQSSTTEFKPSADLQKQRSNDSVGEQVLKESFRKQDSERSTGKQDSKESTKESKDSIVQQDSKTTLKRQDSMMKQDSQDSLKEKIIKIEKTNDLTAIVEQTDSAVDRKAKQELVNKRTKSEETIKKQESKPLAKAKSEESSSQLKSKKRSSTSSSTSSESKIPKASNKFVKLSSTSSSTSTPSKKSISSKSSSTSGSSKSSPIKKSKTFVLQTTVEERPDRVENSLFGSEPNKDERKADKKDDDDVKDKREDSFDKTIIFDEDKISIGKIELKTETEEKLLKTDEKTELIKSDRRLSMVSFQPGLPQMDSLDVEMEPATRKRYAKTPIKQLSVEEKADLIEKLNGEELSVSNDRDDDSSPQSLNEELNKEQIRKEKNDLIEYMDKKLREESIKQFKEIEEIAVRKLIDEEQKLLSKQETVKKEEKVITIKDESIKDEQKVSTKDEQKVRTKDEKRVLIKDEKVDQANDGSTKETPKDKKTSTKETSKDKKTSTKETRFSETETKEDKKDEQVAKADDKSEIIYKKSSVETSEDITERTAYIENMLRTSGYTEKIIEKANEFINGKDGEPTKEDGIVEEVCVKLVKKNSKDYYNGKDVVKQANDGEKTSDKKETKSESKTTSSSTANNQQSTSRQSVGQSKSTTEKPASQLKKSTSLSKIPISNLQTPKGTLSKKVEIITTKSQRQDDDKSKMTSIEQASFKRNCLKPLQSKSEPIEQAIHRPEFKRKKSNLPPKYSIQLDNEQIKKKWNDIKTNEKDKLQHQQFYSRLRRTTSNPVISNSFDLIYELNKMPQWAKAGVANQSNQKNAQRSNTTSIITQTKRILEKIEKKEIEEVTTRTIINDEEQYTTKTTSREESKTHKSETEESSISGRQCSICKKIIIPITEDMKFCKRDLRKMLSDSALEIKHCRC